MKLFDTVPDSWDVVQITEISDINPTRPDDPPDGNELASFVPMKKVEEMTGKLDPSDHRKWEEINSGYTRFQEGDVVFAKITPSMENGKAALAQNLKNGVAAGTTELHVIRPSERVLSKHILYFVLQEGFRREAEANMTGTAGHMRVPSEFVKSIEIPLPPLSEQERIVAKIEELFSKLDSSVSELEEATQRLEKYRKAILEKAIWGELTANFRQQYGELTNPCELLIDSSEYNPPDEPDMPEVPDEWIMATFGDVFEVYLGSTPKRSNDEYWNGDVNWISSGEVEFSRIKDSDEKITRAGLENCSTTVHPPNTVMLGIIGQGKTRGRAAILDIEAAHNQNTVALRPEEAGIPAEFIYYFFMENYERTRRLGSGNQQKALSKTRVQNMVFPLPPVEEQRKISELLEQSLSTLEKVEKSVEENIKRSNRLRQSILKYAFEGKLVPQGKAEEPPTPGGGDTNLKKGAQVTLSEVITDVE